MEQDLEYKHQKHLVAIIDLTGCSDDADVVVIKAAFSAMEAAREPAARAADLAICQADAVTVGAAAIALTAQVRAQTALSCLLAGIAAKAAMGAAISAMMAHVSLSASIPKKAKKTKRKVPPGGGCE